MKIHFWRKKTKNEKIGLNGSKSSRFLINKSRTIKQAYQMFLVMENCILKWYQSPEGGTEVEIVSSNLESNDSFNMFAQSLEFILWSVMPSSLYYTVKTRKFCVATKWYGGSPNSKYLSFMGVVLQSFPYSNFHLLVNQTQDFWIRCFGILHATIKIFDNHNFSYFYL